MHAEAGFRLIIDKELKARSGDIDVDYLSGPFRRGFQVKTANQAAGGCSPSESGCSSCG
ncbi:MAG: hypothetical protein HY900_17615 [Deltaproteobacteria bacterium]|nr:hypothetical protein [Deltaproteobacteria bacterium]